MKSKCAKTLHPDAAAQTACAAVPRHRSRTSTEYGLLPNPLMLPTVSCRTRRVGTDPEFNMQSQQRAGAGAERAAKGQPAAALRQPPQLHTLAAVLPVLGPLAHHLLVSTRRCWVAYGTAACAVEH